jgi:hypothetical protein
MSNVFKTTFREVADELRQFSYDAASDYLRDRFHEVQARLSGLQRRAYLIFGEVVKSIVFAIDPYHNFIISKHRWSPVNRYREVDGIEPCERSFTLNETSTGHLTVDASFPYGNSYSSDSSTVIRYLHYALPAQESIPGHIWDTSYNTRESDQDLGEAEFYFPFLSSKPFSYTLPHFPNYNYFYLDPRYKSTQEGGSDVSWSISGQGVRLTKAAHDEWLENYRDYLLGRMSDEGTNLLAKCTPTSRRFNLAYNIAELRDLPLLLKETVNFYRHLGINFTDPTSLSNAYLAYKFGWESTVKAVLDMMSLPNKVAKQVNYLINRDGKDTTIRARYNLNEPLATLPSFENVQIAPDEYDPLYSVTGTHHGYIQMAVNYHLQFPKIDRAQLRANVFARKFGLHPSPSDLYDLIPWSWFVDWFSGLGDYVHALEAINYDTSLVNYGSISAKTKLRIASEATFKTNKSRFVQLFDLPSGVFSTTTDSIKGDVNRSAELFADFYIRRRIDSLLDVKLTSTGHGLSPYQLAIVTALTGKYGERTAKNLANSKRVISVPR